MRATLPRRAALPALVAALAGLVYLNSLGNGFAHDDRPIIERNPHVHSLDLPAIWTGPYWPERFGGASVGIYRPLALTAYALEWALGGGRPWPFHLVNVLLHALVSALAFLLLARLVPRGAALAGALVFALHPVHVEAVANGVGQAELWAALGLLGALLAHARRRGPGVSAARVAVVGGLYALALLAKEGAVVLPGLLLLWDVAEGRVERSGTGVRRYGREMAPLLAVLLGVLGAYLVLRSQVLGAVTGTNPGPYLPFLQDAGARLLTALRVWPEYMRLLFFPADLSSDYSPGVILRGSLRPMAALGAVLLLGTVGLALLVWTRPGVGLAPAWFLVTILPVSNLLFPVGILLGERTLYLPSFAMALLLASGAAVLGERWRARPGPPAARLAPAALALALVLLGARTTTRNRVWKDTATVYNTLFRDHPESYRAQWGRAEMALEAGDTSVSELHWELAYRIWPHDANLLVDYGQALIRRGKYTRAEKILRQATALQDQVPGRHTPAAWELLAAAYLAQGRPAAALDALRRAEQRFGPRSQLLALRATAYEATGELERAVVAWRAALAAPGGRRRWDYWLGLARTLARSGDLSAARPAADSARLLAARRPAALATIREQLRGVGLPE